MNRLIQVEDYEAHVGPEVIARIQRKAAKLRDLRVVNFNATY